MLRQLLRGSWPLLGDRPAFHSDATGFLLRIAQEQGDVARFRLGRREAVLLAHPDLIRTVLVDRAVEFGKGRLMQRARRLLGDGLLTSEGEAHRAQRRHIQRAFSRERLRGYSSLVPSLVARHTARWRSGTRVRVDAEMDSLAMRTVAGALFGADIEDELPALGQALRLLSRWRPSAISSCHIRFGRSEGLSLGISYRSSSFTARECFGRLEGRVAGRLCGRGRKRREAVDDDQGDGIRLATVGG